MQPHCKSRKLCLPLLPAFVLGLFLFLPYTEGSRPNILMIIADDLGYGDTSVAPFTGTGIYTPELQHMAEASLVYTNFHTAAPVCTPTRASILTGLFPWRVGIKAIYGTGVQANDYLEVIRNLPNTLQSAGYYTAHVGKWHLGGLTPRDIKKRQNPAGTSDCRPGPNQHGFDEYISMMEGPESPRLKMLLPSKSLYSRGSKYLLRNDIPYASSDEVLTDRQTRETIRIMRETVSRGKNFFIQLAYDAPHGPWEIIPGNWVQNYTKQGLFKKKDRLFKYATMVSSLDHSIGALRRAVASLEIANDTLIIFLSDNGPEVGAGTAGPYRGGKRSLLEGGIRVPAMFEWKGKIKSNNCFIDDFVISTDLLPTILDAAQITKPDALKVDGVSILDKLLSRSHSSDSSCISSLKQKGDEHRSLYWYKDLDGCASAVWANGYKLLMGCHGNTLVGVFNMTSKSIYDESYENQIPWKVIKDVNLYINVTENIANLRSFIRSGNKPFMKARKELTRTENEDSGRDSIRNESSGCLSKKYLKSFDWTISGPSISPKF